MSGVVLGLDVGTRRTGVAQARLDVGIPQPLTTIQGTEAGDEAQQRIAELVSELHVVQIVVGWPRGLAGQATEQTAVVEQFVAVLRKTVSVPVALQDEALTSQKAEAELAARRKPYTKEDIDALAATYILEDYLQSHAADLTEANHV